MCLWIKHGLKANNVLIVLLNLNYVQKICIHFHCWHDNALTLIKSALKKKGHNYKGSPINMISGTKKKKKWTLYMDKVSEQVKQGGNTLPVFPDVLQYILI